MQKGLLKLCFTALFAFNVLSCGTALDWMNAYDNIKTSNEWRNSMNKFESLVMLLSCGSSTHLDKIQQDRLSRILSTSLKEKSKLIRLHSLHSMTKKSIQMYKSLIAYEALIESIYIRFHCLSQTNNSYLQEMFGKSSCIQTDSTFMNVNAKGGGFLRVEPKGAKLSSLENGLKVRIIGIHGDWLRVANPLNLGPSSPKVGYMHKSILLKSK